MIRILKYIDNLFQVARTACQICGADSGKEADVAPMVMSSSGVRKLALVVKVCKYTVNNSMMLLRLFFQVFSGTKFLAVALPQFKDYRWAIVSVLLFRF